MIHMGKSVVHLVVEQRWGRMRGGNSKEIMGYSFGRKSISIEGMNKIG